MDVMAENALTPAALTGPARAYGCLWKAPCGGSGLLGEAVWFKRLLGNLHGASVLVLLLF